MKIFYFSDASFLDMKERFENSFKDEFVKEFSYIANINVDRLKPGSGRGIWRYKTEMILSAIERNQGEIIIVSDIDIRYKAVIPTVMEAIEECDICFQKETKTEGANIGFIGIRCNDITLQFWKRIYEILCTSDKWDQLIVNELIYDTKFPIRWGLFPSTIWCWSQGDLNKEIILHHANWVSDKLDKYRQMDDVAAFISTVSTLSPLPIEPPAH